MLDYIWSNWSEIMDWLAKEPVTDWLSILAGYIVFCVTIVTLGLPSLLLMHFQQMKLITIGFVLTIAIVAFLIVMFQTHAMLNLYQAWYSTPLGPALEL